MRVLLPEICDSSEAFQSAGPVMEGNWTPVTQPTDQNLRVLSTVSLRNDLIYDWENCQMVVAACFEMCCSHEAELRRFSKCDVV